MKLNLLLDNERGVLNGYKNIDPFGPNLPSEQDNRIKGDIFPLDWMVDDGECDEIISRHNLCYFPASMIGTGINSWMKKLRKGGFLCIEEIDYGLICDSVVSNKITLKEAHKFLYGEQTKKWNFKKSGLSIGSICDFVEGSGFKVIEKRIFQLNFCIKAIRG